MIENLLKKAKRKCGHGRIALFCCSCNYGERGWQKSKKGMIAERDVVDFIKFNKDMRVPVL